MEQIISVVYFSDLNTNLNCDKQPIDVCQNLTIFDNRFLVLVNGPSGQQLLAYEQLSLDNETNEFHFALVNSEITNQMIEYSKLDLDIKHIQALIYLPIPNLLLFCNYNDSQKLFMLKLFSDSPPIALEQFAYSNWIKGMVLLYQWVLLVNDIGDVNGLFVDSISNQFNGVSSNNMSLVLATTTRKMFYCDCFHNSTEIIGISDWFERLICDGKILLL